MNFLAARNIMAKTNEFTRYVKLAGGHQAVMSQLNYSRSMVFKLISGERYPSRVKAFQICEKYPEISLSGLLGKQSS